MTAPRPPWLVLATALTLALLPFETPIVALPLGGLLLTSLEALLLLVVGLWLHTGPWRAIPTALGRLLWPVAAVAATTLLAALLAPDLRALALKVAGRWLLTLLFGLAVATLAQGRYRPWLLYATLLSAVLVALLGLAELAAIPGVAALLGPFRESPALLGPAARLSATFGSANTAAMFLETGLCLALGLGLAARSRRSVAAASTLAALLALAIAFTYSRGGALGATAGIAVIALAYLRGASPAPHAPPRTVLSGDNTTRTSKAVTNPLSPPPPTAAPAPSPYSATRGAAPGSPAPSTQPTLSPTRRLTALIPVAAALAAVILAAALDPVFRARLAFLDPRPLDAAHVAAPATLAGRPDDVVTVPVTVTNAGRLAWPAAGPQAVIVGYHWLSANGDTVLRWGHAHVPLPDTLPPGAAAAIPIPITLPTAGRYTLAWDVAQPGGAWLGARLPLTARTTVHIDGPGGHPLDIPYLAPTPDPPPSRLALWSAALHMLRGHPLLGVGPGNFRHLYGRYLDLAEWDPRILANSLYFELLADVGLLGAAAWFALLLSVWLHLARRAAHAHAPAWPEAVALLGAWTAWLVHGLVDVALETLAVAALFWTLVGLSATIVLQLQYNGKERGELPPGPAPLEGGG